MLSPHLNQNPTSLSVLSNDLCVTPKQVAVQMLRHSLALHATPQSRCGMRVCILVVGGNITIFPPPSLPSSLIYIEKHLLFTSSLMLLCFRACTRLYGSVTALRVAESCMGARYCLPGTKEKHPQINSLSSSVSLPSSRKRSNITIL